METSTTDTRVNPKKADTEEKTNHYNLFGQPSFHDPGTPKGERRPKGKKYPLDDLSEFAVARKPLTCVMFSDFISQINQFSEIEKVKLRSAVNFTRVMTYQVLQVIKPGPSQFDYKNPPQHLTKILSKLHPKPNEFEEQLMFWFGSTSPEITSCVREGMLKMHALLTNPVAIITFVNDCAIKNNPGDGVHQHPGADNEDFALPKPNGGVLADHVIHINENTTLARLQVRGMARYIFHELTHDVLKLPKYSFDREAHLLSARDQLHYQAMITNSAVKVPGNWTHFVWALYSNSINTAEIAM